MLNKRFRNTLMATTVSLSMMPLSNLSALAQDQSNFVLSKEIVQQKLQANSSQSKNVKTPPQKMSPDNLLAEEAKPSVVRIGMGYKAKVYFPKNGKIYDLEQMVSYGTGFYVSPNGDIATAAHVTDLTFKDYEQLLWRQLANQLETDGVNLDDVEQELKWIELKPINLVFLPNGQQLPFQVVVSGARAGKGKDVSIIKINVQNAPVLKLANSGQVKRLDSVIVVGYPAIVDNPGIKLRSASFYEASFTSGKVSAFKTLEDGTPVIQIIAPIPGGNSGGPVLNEQGEVIGIVSFGPDDNFTFIFTSNTIQEFLASAHITNEQGLVNQKYREGLQLYSQGRYRQALSKFQLVKRLFSKHSGAEEFLQNCQQVIANSN